MLELYSWGPGHDDLPSFDPFSLSAELYLNLAGVDWTPHDCNDVTISPTGALPVLQDGPTVVCGSFQIIDHLRRKGHDLDSALSSSQRVECLAFSSILEDSLYDALLHNWWIDQENYTRHTSPLYSRAMPFFSRYTGPQKIRERVRKRLRKYETSSETSSSGERLHAVYQSAQLGYEALSRKLGSNSYFFGQKPSSLDVVALSHLLLHLSERPPNPTLRNLLIKHQNLVDFCERFKPVALAHQPRPVPRPTLASWIGTKYELLIREPSTGSLFTSWKSWIPTRKTLGKAAGVVAVLAAFVGYVISNGIVQIDMGGEPEYVPPPRLMQMHDIDINDLPPVDDEDEEEEEVTVDQYEDEYGAPPMEPEESEDEDTEEDE